MAGKLGLQLGIVHPSASAVWAPTGIALAALLILGLRVWPGIFVGAFVVNATTAGSIATSLGIATGNTLEALIGAALVNRFANGRQAFDHPRDTFVFALLAGMLSTCTSASIGVTSLSLGGFASWEDFGSIWWTWWLGDMGGALVVTPLLVLWFNNPRLRWSRTQTPLAAAAETPRPIVNDRLVVLQVFVAVAAVTTLALAAVVSERRRIDAAVRETTEELHEAMTEL